MANFTDGFGFQNDSDPKPPSQSPEAFWDALAEHHAAIEENYLDLASLRRILGELRSPVLVVGAGQGLLVEELRAKGFRCDGVDFSSEMVRHAKRRRDLDIIQANALALPFAEGTYETLIYATGVIDFMGDERAVRGVLVEGRRVLRPGGEIFVAFYRLSPALEGFVSKLGLLRNGVLLNRQCLEMYLLSRWQMILWVRKTSRTGWLGAIASMLRLALLGTLREKTTTLKMQRIVRRMEHPEAFLQAAPETQPYRNSAEIGALFDRLGFRVEAFKTLGTCYIVQL